MNALRKMSIPAMLAITGTLAACGNAPNDPGPGGVSNADADALDEAAAKLDRVDPDAYREEVEPPANPLYEDD